MDLEIDFRFGRNTSSGRTIFSMETPIATHTPTDIGRTVLSLGAILAVVFAFWQMQNSVREEIRPELTELRRDVRSIEEKVNHMMGQQDALARRLGPVK